MAVESNFLSALLVPVAPPALRINCRALAAMLEQAQERSLPHRWGALSNQWHVLLFYVEVLPLHSTANRARTSAVNVTKRKRIFRWGGSHKPIPFRIVNETASGGRSSRQGLCSMYAYRTFVPTLKGPKRVKNDNTVPRHTVHKSIRCSSFSHVASLHHSKSQATR